MWPQLAAAAIGLLLMAAPGVLGYGDLPADLHHVIGPLVASVGIVAASPVLRGLRWVNLLLGMVLVALTAAVPMPAAAGLTSFASGAALLVLSPWRGRIPTSYGGGWRAVLHGGAGR